jgi:hypothetical protein
MLGPRVLASQTGELYRLYDATGRQVPASVVVGIIFLFCDLKAVFRAFGGAKPGQRVTCPCYGSYTSKYSNAFLPVRCLLSMSVHVNLRREL